MEILKQFLTFYLLSQYSEGDLKEKGKPQETIVFIIMENYIKKTTNL